jgi:hypothetical protein
LRPRAGGQINQEYERQYGRAIRKSQIANCDFHLPSTTSTGWPSFKSCLPIKITGSFSFTPSRISTETPSLNPILTATFFAFCQSQ